MGARRVIELWALE